MTEQRRAADPAPRLSGPAAPDGARTREERRLPGRPRTGYLPQLDGLRALAIVLVLVHHAVTPWTFGGLVGVDVFFVLSGYLITNLLVGEYDRSGSVRLRRFYARRMIRLYPALLVVVGVLFIPGLLVARHRAYFLLDVATALTYLTPIALQLNPGASVVFRHTWSLGIEELFYLGWPLLLLLMLGRQRSRLLPTFVAGALGSLLLASGVVQSLTRGDLSYLLRSGGLFLGCALALHLRRREKAVGPGVGWIGLLLLACGVTSATVGVDEGLAVCLASAGALALTAHLARPQASGVLVKVLSRRAVAYVGRISYEIYLWHYPLFMLASRVTGRTFASVAWFCVPVSLLLAVLTHAVLAPMTERWKVRADRAMSRAGTTRPRVLR